MKRHTSLFRKLNVVFLFTLLLIFTLACSREINPKQEPTEDLLMPVKLQVLDEENQPVKNVSIAFSEVKESPTQDIGLNVERTGSDGMTETKLKKKASYDVALIQEDKETKYIEVTIPNDLEDDVLTLIY